MKKLTETSKRNKLLIEIYMKMEQMCKVVESAFGPGSEVYSPFGFDSILDCLGFPKDTTVECSDAYCRPIPELEHKYFCRDYLYDMINSAGDELLPMVLEYELDHLKENFPELFEAEND